MHPVESTPSRRHQFIDRLGIHPPFAWGYLGLLLFMIGDGVESGYLSPYLSGRGLSESEVAVVFTVYGVTAERWRPGSRAPYRTCGDRAA